MVAEAEGKERGGVDPAAGFSGKIERGEMQLLLADADEVMTKLRVKYRGTEAGSGSFVRACPLQYLLR